MDFPAELAEDLEGLKSIEISLGKVNERIESFEREIEARLAKGSLPGDAALITTTAAPLLSTLSGYKSDLASASIELSALEGALPDLDRDLELKRDRLEKMKQETEAMISGEKETIDKDRAIMEEIAQEIAEYEKTKELERLKAKEEAQRKVDELRKETELLRKLVGDRENSKNQSNAASSDTAIHDEFARVFRSHRP